MEKIPWRFHKMQVICAVSGLVLFAAVKAAGEGGILEDGMVKRPDPGQGESEYIFYVIGLEEEEIPITVAVGEREYGEEEAEEVFRKAWEDLLLTIPGENVSLSQVRADLSLPGWLDKYGLKVRWYSEDPEILDNYGKIQKERQENLTEEGETLWLRAVLSDSSKEKEFQVPLTVRPVLLTEKEKRVKGLSQDIAAADKSQRQEEWLKLPLEYEGKTLEYQEKNDDHAKFFPAMGFIMAVLYGLKGKQDQQQERKKRSRQMLLDYSEIVSRLMVFIGAGMTVRGAWGKMVRDYEKRLKEKEGTFRYAYEEMARTYYQMDAGKGEGEAYEEFGRRCGLQPYMKLAGILIQNKKEGMKNLNYVMKEEMTSAFEERKNLARRQGEEAGTKLLAPLFCMLGVVMVMVMAPAMLAFS